MKKDKRVKIDINPTSRPLDEGFELHSWQLIVGVAPKHQQVLVQYTVMVILWTLWWSWDYDDQGVKIRASLQTEKDHQNIVNFWGFIEKFSLFWDHMEALVRIKGLLIMVI